MCKTWGGIRILIGRYQNGKSDTDPASKRGRVTVLSFAKLNTPSINHRVVPNFVNLAWFKAVLWIRDILVQIRISDKWIQLLSFSAY